MDWKKIRMNHKIEDYTDGWANFYNRKDKGNRNIENIEDLIFLQKMAFKEKNARSEDVLFADSNGHSLNKKIKVMNVKFIKERQYVKIENVIYYLYRVDLDRQNNELYLYLESLRELE